MASEEQYLDDLLKSMVESEPKQRTMEDAMRDVNQSSWSKKADEISSDDLADMLDQLEVQNTEKMEEDDWKQEIDDLFRMEDSEHLAEDELIPEETEENHLPDEPLSEEVAEEEKVVEEETTKEEMPFEEPDLFQFDEEKEQTEPQDDGMDLMDLIRQLDMQTGEESDLSTETTEHSNQTTTSDEDMLALLEGLQNIPDETDGENQGERKETSECEDDASPKKKNFILRILERLLQEDEEDVLSEQEAEQNENATGENEQILEEIKEEKQEGKRKKEKKKKKSKGVTQSSLVEESDEDALEEKPKKNKIKKEKKVKSKPLPEPSPQVLSQKTLTVLVAFCATLTACIVFLSNFLPEYADKVKARQSFYAGDYATTYENLYNKVLSESDTIIYNRARMVLMLRQKLNSYENRMTFGKELEAVDALFQGVWTYQMLSNRDAGIQEELDVIYAEICNVLWNKYGISAQEAEEIITYDEIAYTQKLNAVLYGTEFYLPGEEPVEEVIQPPQDILPDEEEWIDMGEGL